MYKIIEAWEEKKEDNILIYEKELREAYTKLGADIILSILKEASPNKTFEIIELKNCHHCGAFCRDLIHDQYCDDCYDIMGEL